MTIAEWEQVGTALSGTYGRALLKVDGRTLQFHRGLISKDKLGIIMYIDGVWKGAWIGLENEHPEQKFLHRKKRYRYTAKHRTRLGKLGKRFLKQQGINPSERVAIFSVLWPSGAAIRRHYEKTFQSIELVEVIG